MEGAYQNPTYVYLEEGALYYEIVYTTDLRIAVIYAKIKSDYKKTVKAGEVLRLPVDTSYIDKGKKCQLFVAELPLKELGLEWIKEEPTEWLKDIPESFYICFRPKLGLLEAELSNTAKLQEGIFIFSAVSHFERWSPFVAYTLVEEKTYITEDELTVLTVEPSQMI